jgi:hypothetical protein
VSSSSVDDTDSTESYGEYDSELHSDVDMRMEDDEDTPDGVDLDGDGDLERDGEDEEDEEKEEEEEVDEDEKEDEDEDNGKEPGTIGQGKMLNPSANDAVTMVHDQPTVLPEQGQQMREHAPQPQPPAHTPRPQSPEPRPLPRTPETHTLSGLQVLGLVTPQIPHPAAPTLQKAEAAGNISDLDVEQQLLGGSAGGDSPHDVHLPDVPLPNVPLPNVPLPDVPLPDVPLPDDPLPEARLDDSVGEERTSPHVSLGLGLGSCLVSFLFCNPFISGTY